MSKRRALLERLIALRDTKRAKASEQTMNESAFFAKLNYDVRCVIYDHLYEYLPPLARKWHANGVPQDDCCQGLILSCKLANMELLDAAGRHWKTYLNGFQEDFETYYGKPITVHREIPLQPGWGALRSVMLSVAAKYLSSRKDLSPGFQHRLDIDVRIRSPIDPLRRLLERPFDKVTLLFTCPEVESAPPEEEVTNSLWHQLMEMHGDVGTIISRQWLRFMCEDDKEKLHQYRENPSLILPHLKYEDDECCEPWCKYATDAYRSKSGPKRQDYTSDDEHRFARAQWDRLCSPDSLDFIWEVDGGDYDDPHTLKRIQTKEIAFAWDYRDFSGPLNGLLLGKKRRYQQAHVDELARADLLHLPTTIEEYDKEWPYRCYFDLQGWEDVSDNDSLVGMWVVGHPKRWMLTSQEPIDDEDDCDGLECGLTNGRVEHVECEGIGKPVVARTTEATRWPGA